MKDVTDFNCFLCDRRNDCQFYCKISRLPRSLGGLGQCPKLNAIQEETDEKRIHGDTPIKKRRTVTRTRRKTVLRKRATTRKSNRKKVTGD